MKLSLNAKHAKLSKLYLLYFIQFYVNKEFNSIICSIFAYMHSVKVFDDITNTAPVYESFSITVMRYVTEHNIIYMDSKWTGGDQQSVAGY